MSDPGLLADDGLPWVNEGKEALRPLAQRMIDAIRNDAGEHLFWPEIENGPAHIVIADGNCMIGHIDYCIDLIRKGQYINWEVPQSASAALAFLLCLRTVLTQDEAVS